MILHPPPQDGPDDILKKMPEHEKEMQEILDKIAEVLPNEVHPAVMGAVVLKMLRATILLAEEPSLQVALIESCDKALKDMAKDMLFRDLIATVLEGKVDRLKGQRIKVVELKAGEMPKDLPDFLKDFFK